MITFLASPKPFVGSAGVIQRNAILSWKAVHPSVEIIIYGRGEGVEEACSELGAIHVPDVDSSSSGAPFFNSIVGHARDHAKYDVQCYLNCDIILAGAIMDAIKALPYDYYLITGHRIDLQQDVTIDVTKDQWRSELIKIINQGKASLHPPSGMDYFIFKRGMWKSLLPLVIGRGGYDDALVLYCLRNKIPFINGSLSIIALHQFHDYGHQRGGREFVMVGADAQNNRKLHKNYHSIPNSADAPWLLVDGKLIKNSIQEDWLRKIEHIFRFRFGLETLSLSFRILWRIAVRCGIIKPKPILLKQIIEATILNNADC